MRRMFSLKQLQEIADARVEALVEGGTISNAKPIYCHPISLTRSGDNGHMRLTMLIFNNTATAFTLTTFKEWLETLQSQIDSVRIMVSGGVQDLVNSKYIISASYIACYEYNDQIEYNIAGIYDNGNYQEIYGSWNDVFHDVSLTDNVNKIN